MCSKALTISDCVILIIVWKLKIAKNPAKAGLFGLTIGFNSMKFDVCDCADSYRLAWSVITNEVW